MRVNRKYLAATIANRVAFNWLRDAESLLAEGKNPAPLSSMHRMLVMEETSKADLEVSNHFVCTCAREAVKIARHALLCGVEFPRTKSWAMKRAMDRVNKAVFSR